MPIDSSQALQAANQQIEALLKVRDQLRAQGRALDARAQTLSRQPQINNVDLRGSLGSFVPPHLMPGNVGPLNAVIWPFWFPVDFDYGDDYTIKGGGLDPQNQTFQVTQEAAMLLVSVTRQADTYGTAGHLGPWTLTIRDNQSSRQFNDQPIPIQQLSRTAGKPTMLPTAMLLMPNAQVTLQMNSWLPAGTDQATTGSSHMQFGLFGYRVRIEDTEKVMSSVFMPAGLGV